MSTSKKVWIPAILIVIAGLLLVAYSLYLEMNGTHPGPSRGGGGLPPEGGKKEGELFEWLGTAAVVCGAVSFLWLRFKKKLRSPSEFVRTAGGLLRRLHTWMGWTALVLVGVHGVYYLVTKLQDHKIYTGLAAFLILAALAGYGWLMPRIRNVWMRKVHLLLSLVWIPLLLLHAGGSAILTVAVTAAVWVLVGFLDRRSSLQKV
ncbi:MULTISPECIES: hypothetical protein [Paenibacillus]|uniref:hypothetical protein n=1 Tax=Paenibacillus TaxID=44249 RepID=UPI0022B8B098|nr:hypothetical protein [Paenibacillus caseinilyticus]MCZ8522633.1 hypothetical protein [Paenibacillus caseinilyticus]